MPQTFGLKTNNLRTHYVEFACLSKTFNMTDYVVSKVLPTQSSLGNSKEIRIIEIMNLFKEKYKFKKRMTV